MRTCTLGGILKMMCCYPPRRGVLQLEKRMPLCSLQLPPLQLPPGCSAAVSEVCASKAKAVHGRGRALLSLALAPLIVWPYAPDRPATSSQAQQSWKSCCICTFAVTLANFSTFEVKSDVGFDHMHKHGPGDDTDRLPSLQRHVWRAVGVLQPRRCNQLGYMF